MLSVVGWHPHAPHRKDKNAAPAEQVIKSAVIIRDSLTS